MSKTSKKKQQQVGRLAAFRPLDEPIRLHRSGQYTDITPAVKGLDRYLYTVRHEAVADSEHGVRVEKQVYPLVWPHEGRQGRASLQCFAGLEPMVVDLLGAMGCSVTLSGERPGMLAAPNIDNVALMAADSPVLDLIRQHDRGLVRYDPRGVDPAVLVSQIASAWPKAKMVITATRVGDAHEMRKRLEESLGKVALFTGKHHPSRGSRVIVATPDRLGDGAVEIEKRDIFITLNPYEIVTRATEGLHEAPLEGIKRLWRARMFGLVADDVILAPWQRSWMTALFGQQEVHVPRHGHHDLPVDVIFGKFYGGERPRVGEGVDLLRQGIWGNHLRNRRLASLFRSLTTNDEEMLAQKFEDVAAHLHGRLGGRIGLLVDGVEHALALAERLPGVPLMTDPGVCVEGLSPEQVNVICPEKKTKTKEYAIVTTAGLAHAPRFDVLVRADGGVGLPALPDAYKVISNDDEVKLMLVDFTDEHHPALARRGRQRRNAYLGAGWRLLGRDAPSAMERFVAQRPEVCG